MWRNELLRLVKRNYEFLNGDIYQFGVWSGDSMMLIATFFAENKIPVKNMWGFDVFTGFPLETAEPIFQDNWQPGNYNATETFGLTVEEIASRIESKVRKVFTDRGQDCNVKIITGLAEETVNDEFVKKYSPNNTIYVDMDFDIYSPSKHVLDFLVKSNLITPGTIIGYDDWGGTPWINFEHGESRAHKEVFIDNNIDAQLIFHYGPDESQWHIKDNPHVQQGYLIK